MFPRGRKIRILELEARSATDEFIRASEWAATRSRTSDGGPAIGVRPLMSSPPTHVRLTLGTGQTTESGYYRFVRTSRVDVTCDDISAEAADGVVSIETGEYTIERFRHGWSKPAWRF